jgi:hypothetical protein
MIRRTDAYPVLRGFPRNFFIRPDPFSPVLSVCLSARQTDMELDASYWDGSSANSQAEMYPQANTTGMPDDLFRFVNFIHNEYAREMNTEYPYLETIHHAGTHHRPDVRT